ncbi:MAG: hypothetical protein U5L76_04335 [Patescibacteria group bacterium]|nr:hypothetical protein [Patescibacteria group bacterium]
MNFDYHGSIFTWRRKIAIFSFKKDMVAIVIKSKELAKMQQTLFETFWNSINKQIYYILL